MALTDDYQLLTDQVISKIVDSPAWLTENKVDPKNVFYGDREKIGATPTITVFPGPQAYDLGGNMNRTDNRMIIYLIVYFGKVQAVEDNLREVDKLTMSLKRLLHKDLQMGGLVTNGYVRAIDPGYTIRAGVLLRATRVTWEGYNRTMLTGA